MASTPLTSRQYQINDLLEAIELYHDKGWTDGLPVIPPTEKLVQDFLEAGGREPSDILGVEPVRGRVITAEKAAINAVMAGCKSQYFPVVAAAVEAICQESFNLHAITVSTAGAAIMTIVNGPIVKALGMNSGISLFGPGNRANATIGRALTLIVMNVTGAVPGELDKATLGHPGKYSYCIAEAEEVSPWEPLHVERGLSSDASAVTVFAALSPWQVSNHSGNTPKAVLTSMADVLKAVGHSQGEVVLVMSPEHLDHIKAAKWSKGQVKEFLAGKAQRTVREWIEAGRLELQTPPDDLDKSLGACSSSDAVTIVIGGGMAGGFSSIIPLWGGGTGSRSVTREVQIPSSRAMSG